MAERSRRAPLAGTDFLGHAGCCDCIVAAALHAPQAETTLQVDGCKPREYLGDFESSCQVCT